jgi:hypothetical protein
MKKTKSELIAASNTQKKLSVGKNLEENNKNDI